MISYDHCCFLKASISRVLKTAGVRVAQSALIDSLFAEGSQGSMEQSNSC